MGEKRAASVVPRACKVPGQFLSSVRRMLIPLHGCWEACAEKGTKRSAYARAGVAYYVIYDPCKHLGEEVLEVDELRAREYTTA